MLILLVKIFIGYINKALSISGRWPAMLQNLSKDIRECLTAGRAMQAVG